MKLNKEFYQLPFKFDVEKLQSEIAQFDESEWHPHHEHFRGNLSLPLISVNGGLNNDFKGQMKPTKHLAKTPYIRQIMTNFNEVFGRSRLMRLEPDCEVPLHSDINYHWYKRVRIHIPITTSPDVLFYCGDECINMAQGDTWIFDTWRHHKVVNNSNASRVHLVLDTTGSSRFWDLLSEQNQQKEPLFIPFIENAPTKIITENFNVQTVMSPGELDYLISELINEIQANTSNAPTVSKEFERILQTFSQEWRQLYSVFGTKQDGWPHYHHLRDATVKGSLKVARELKLSNGDPAIQMLIHCIVDPALNPEVAS